MPLGSGSRLGPYEIVSALGTGGMGEVYRATDTTLGRQVAIKVLPETFEQDGDRLARFEREAKTLASLNHPHIAQIYGLEKSGGVHALVMELVEGEDLSERIARGPVPLDEALPIARQIADALEAAHEQGIIHRDLKPANIKVRQDGTVKVLDFGLAKAMEPAAASSPSVSMSPTITTPAMTMRGMILGTAAYMAPEQAKGKSVDKRADIWAFGVVLFEMLTGQRAFKGEDVSDVLASVLRQEIDWSALPPGTPVKVRRVLERCLQRDPKQRLRDIGDAWIGMEAPDEPAPVASSTTLRPVSAAMRWLPWVAALLVAAGSIAWTIVRAPASEPRVVTRAVQPIKDASYFVNVSRDGTRVAYAGSGGAGTMPGIVLRMLDQFDGKVIPGTEGNGEVSLPFFSPDGQWIVYGDVGEIRKIPVTGGTPITLCNGRFRLGAAWGDDNTIVFSGATGLMRVSADGGTPETLTTIDSAKGETAHTRPQFLPGGRQLLFTVTSTDGAQFAVRDLDKGGYRTIAKGGVNGQYVASGHLTYVRGATLFAVPFDLTRLEVTGGEVPVTENVSTIGPLGTGDYSVSPTGLLAYFVDTGGGGTTLAWADRTGATKVLPGQSRRDWGTGRLSPDGSRVANGIANEKGLDIWVLDVGRGTPTRLTFGGRNDVPIWTPDGRHVVYQGIQDEKFGLYSVPADASARPALVLATESAATPTSFTPDGKTLVYTQDGPDKRSRIQLVPFSLNGPAGQPHPLHEASGAEGEAQISPDGHWVSYTSAESGSREVYLQPFPGPGAKTRVSPGGGARSRWARDGRELFYWVNLPAGALMAADVTTNPALHVGEPHQLFKLSVGTTWDVTPDRNRFLIELGSTGSGSSLAIVTNWFEELRRRAPAKK